MEYNFAFRNNFNFHDINFLAQKRLFREMIGGSYELEKESKQEIREGIMQVKKEHLNNPEEILNKNTVSQLDENLKANPLQRKWWDSGANESSAPLQDTNVEDLIIQSRTSNMEFNDRLQPNPTLQAQQSAATDLRTLKEQFAKAQKYKNPKRF